MKSQEQILQILRESPKPLGPSEIKLDLDIKKPTVIYHLNKLVEEGKVEKQKGKYSIIDKENLRLLEKKLINKLSNGICSFDGLLIEGYDEIKIYQALNFLFGKGIIEDEPLDYSLSPEYKEHRMISLSPLGYTKIGKCFVCNNKFNKTEKILSGWFRPKTSNFTGDFNIAIIHAECSPYFKPHSKAGIKKLICSNCGLPLDPKLISYQVAHEQVSDHFFIIEIDTIALLEDLFQRLKEQGKKHSSREKLSAYTIQRTHHSIVDLLKKHLEKYGQKGDKFLLAWPGSVDAFKKEIEGKSPLAFPDWLLKNIISYEEGQKEIKGGGLHITIKPPFSDVFEDIFEIFSQDLSELSGAERFINGIMNYMVPDKIPEQYNSNQRIKEIWSAAQKTKEKERDYIEEKYRELLEVSDLIEPSDSIYSGFTPTWAFRTKLFGNNIIGDISKEEERARIDDCSTVSSQTIAIKSGDEVYHPYCAKKLGILKDDHGHDKKN